MAITIKNVSTSVVTVIAHDYNFRRELTPGRTVPIDDEIFDQLTFDSGFQNMISAGYIKVNGVADEGVVETPVATVVEVDELEKIMKERNITRFAQIIPTASPATKQAVVELAVKHDVTDRAFSALIQKYCGVDILRAITIEHQAAEPVAVPNV